MSTACPHCQLENACTTPDATCRRCGTPFYPPSSSAVEATPAPDAELLVIEALPSEITAQQAAAETMRPGPGLLGAIGLIIAICIVTVIVVVPLGGLLMAIKPDLTLGGDHWHLLSAIVSSIVMGWCGWLCLSPRAAQRMALCRPRWLHVMIALTLPLLLQIVVMKVQSGLATDETSGPDAGSIWYYYYVIATQPWPLMLLVGAVLPGFCEEVFFRGCLGRGLIARYGILLGVLLTSVLFGLVHLEPGHIAVAFCLGLVIHFVYLCSRSLWTAILLHVTNNVFAFGIYRLQLDDAFPETLAISRLLVCGAPLGVLGLLWVMWRTRPRWEPGELPLEPRRYFSLDRPAADARLVSTPWRGIDLAVLAACLAIFGAVAYGIGKEGWNWHVARELVAAGDDAYLLDDYAKARGAYHAALRVVPDYAPALSGLANTALASGDHETALADADRYLALELGDAVVMATRAAALLGLKRKEEALACAREAARLAPDDAWCAEVLVNVALANKDYALAVDAAWRGANIAEDPTYFESILAWVYLHCEVAELRDAAVGYDYAHRVAARTSYQDLSDVRELAMACVAIGDINEALHWHKVAAELESDSEEYRQAAAHERKLLDESWRLVRRLRDAWHTPYVDDVTCFPGCKKLLVVGPASYVPKLQKEQLGLLGYEGWTFEAMTSAERHQRLTELADQLASTPGVDLLLAERITWRIGPTLQDVLNCDVELFANRMRISLAEAVSLLEAIRQHHAQRPVSKSKFD